MKIAVVISGLARFPEQGYHFLKEIKRRSNHTIDVYAGIWSIDTLPESISSELKGLTTIPYSIRDELLESLKNKNLLTSCLDHSFLNGHSGLISHMETCSVFSKELINYDLVIKWRWDVAITFDHFDLICKNFKNLENFFISDALTVDEGNVLMNEVIFASKPELMIKTFTPTREKFLELGEILDRDEKILGNKIRLGSLSSFTKLIKARQGSIRTVPFLWALLRSNILDNLEYLNCPDIRLLIKLQHLGDCIRDKELLKRNENK